LKFLQKNLENHFNDIDKEEDELEVTEDYIDDWLMESLAEFCTHDKIKIADDGIVV
jgi:hypothetical protein